MFARREALAHMLAGFAVVALVREARAAPRQGRGTAAAWIEEQQHLAEALSAGRIGGAAWCEGVERLAERVDVTELMTLVRASDIGEGLRGSHNDPVKRFVRFRDPHGKPRRLAYGAALFEFAPGNVITPHGHRHMVSAHLVAAGRFRVRNFDRVGDEGGAMLIQPTRDYVARAGQVSTMCSERDNIHWFVPVGGPATTFDVAISGLDAGAPDHLIQAVDPVGASRRADGTLLAPIIGFAEASARYTADL